MKWRISKIISTVPYTKFNLRPFGGVIIRSAVSLSFKVLGDSVEPEASPVILLHGLLGRKSHWESIGKTIMSTAKRGAAVVDLRNHGDSPHTSSQSYIEQAEDLSDLLKKLSVTRTTLLGHSMGGRAAMALALMKPELVANIIVVDISPVSSCPELTENMPKILNAMKSVDFSKVEPLLSKAKAHARQQLEEVITDYITMRSILSNITVNKNSQIDWACNVEGLIKQFDEIVNFPQRLMDKQYLGPALFIGGQLSDYLPPDDLPDIRSMFPNSVITYIKGTRHNVHTDDPQGFFELVIEFLKNNK